MSLLPHILADQRRRHQNGEPFQAEIYFEKFPHVAADMDAALDIICHELILRRQAGQTWNVEEYVQRFPQWEAQLRRQFEVEMALEADSFMETSLDQTASPPAQDFHEQNTLDYSYSEHENTQTKVTGSGSGISATRPNRIGPYDVRDVLGQGGMGVVYRAWHVQLKRMVALKMIVSRMETTPEAVARFCKEAEAIARLQHPNIVQVFDVGTHDDKPYLALELCEGGSLLDKMDQHPLSATEAAELVEKLARAIHHAHQQKIIHRDLKPANVLLTEDGTPKITDFGLAKMLDEVGTTLSGTTIGTPTYMAPEQASGKSKTVTPTADIYALGAILYECLTGRPPFRGNTPWETIVLVVTEDVLIPRHVRGDIPKDLESICLKCLEKDPSRRYATAEELANDLARFLQGDFVRARPLGWRGHLLRWAYRSPALALALSLVAVFYSNHLVLLALGEPNEGGFFHWFVTATVAIWAMAAVGFQVLVRQPRWQSFGPFGWSVLYVILLTAMMLQAKGPTSSMIMTYLVLITGTGLLFRPTVVWVTTAMCMSSYLLLQVDALTRRAERGIAAPFSTFLLFEVSAFSTGLIMVLLLKRFRRALTTRE